MNEWLKTLPLHGIENVTDFGRLIFLLSSIALTMLIARIPKITTRTRRAAAATALVYFCATTAFDCYAVNVLQSVSYHGLNHGLFLGIALDVHVAWASLWCCGFCMLVSRMRFPGRLLITFATVCLTLAFDLWVIQMGWVKWYGQLKWWLIDGSVLLALQTFGLFFFECVRRKRRLSMRAGFYAVSYGYLFYLLIPRLIYELTSPYQSRYPGGESDMGIVLIAVSCMLGIWATFALCCEGGGTPLPLDPTQRIVCVGPYARIRNPMQVSGVLAAIGWFFTTGSIYYLIYALDLILIVELLRPWEEVELENRFGESYRVYRQRVPRWLGLKNRAII